MPRPTNPDLHDAPNAMDRDKLIVIGQAVRAFGIKGEIKIAPFTVSLAAFENSPVLFFGDSPHKVLRVRVHKGAVLATLEGIDTPEKTANLIGRLVRTDVEHLPPKEEDEYYWFELIGMRVSTVDGRELGEITHITPTGANDVLHVEGPLGEILLPMIDDVVISVDTAAGLMVVDPLEGLVPDA